ncbi:DUF2726 domain-containing protein [bacterium]|nr:MAG: DUF2726 domain-containing protein [bacterium]
MSKILIVIGILGAIVIVLKLVLNNTEAEAYPFERKPNFLTPSEMAFFRVLLKIINDQYFVFPQVHLASILQVKKGEFDRKEWKRYFNKLIQKSFDFVILDRETLNPLLVIELDDYTHLQSKRIKRDLFVDNALKSAQINILHIKCEKEYNIEELRTLIFQALSHPGERQ